MLLVVADTGPIHYLVLIGQIGLLPQLFHKIIIPTSVHAELGHASAPDSVREWANAPPVWLEAITAAPNADPEILALDEGEKAAIALSLSLRADLILIDDRRGSIVARRKGFEITGTLGVLTRAAQLGLIDLPEALDRLKATNFRYRQEMLDELLAKYKGSGKP